MSNLGSNISLNTLSKLSFEEALKAILESTAGRLGEEFLHVLNQQLSNIFDFETVFIARYSGKSAEKLKTVSLYSHSQHQDNIKFNIANTFCEKVIQKGFVVHQFDNNKESIKNFFLSEEVKSAVGIALFDSYKENVGVMVGLSYSSLSNIELIKNVLDVFSFRVSAELERQAINQNLRNEVIINQTQLDTVPALMFMLDKKGQFLRWNQYITSNLGYESKAMQGEYFTKVVHQTDRKRIELELDVILAQGHTAVYLNGVTASGKKIPMLATAQATSYEGEPVIVGVAHDMTEQKNVEQNLLRSQGRLASKNSQLRLINSLVEKLHASHSVKHIADHVVNLLQTVQTSSIIAFSIVRPSGKNMEIVASSGINNLIIDTSRIFPVKQNDSPIGIAMQSEKLEVFPDIQNDPRISEKLKMRYRQENIWGGLVLPLIYKGERLGSINIGYKYRSEIPKDEIDFYQTISSSISLALANARQYVVMESLAIRDNLTKLPNRNAFNQDCSTIIRQNKSSEKFIAVILIDLDRFKEINDTLDHQIGDKLLRLIGPRIKESIQDPNIKVYRLGGDEFCLLIGDKVSREAIDNIAAKVETAIAQPFEVNSLNLEIGSSIGVATTQGQERSAAEMLRRAELAMYHAKNNGGGIESYTSELDANTNQRFVIMADMAEAIRNDNLVLHYQPKFHLDSNKIIGCEVLVRWNHYKYGLLAPAKFIPLVELTQLINPLTLWVIKTALAQLQQWKKSGIKINMAINLSTRNLSDDNFIEQVDSLIQQYETDPSYIEFEVTESALMHDLDRAKKQLNAFSKRGIQCSLDDYGTGYSSLTYIKKLPLDILKIDRSFISQMLEDNDDRIIAQSTINLAHSLGMKVVAEGVEDKNTLQALSEKGCDYVQGFYISKPLDAENFEQFYWKHAAEKL